MDIQVLLLVLLYQAVATDVRRMLPPCSSALDGNGSCPINGLAGPVDVESGTVSLP